MAKKLFVIDGYSYLYQAFHAIRNMTGPKGEPTNAIFGFINMMLRIMEKEAPDYIAITFDRKEPSFRHKTYEKYKATRKPMPDELRQQVPVVQEIAEAYQIPVFSSAGFEADDIIGTIVENVKDIDVDTYLITRDKDLKQLIGPKVRIYDTKDGSLYGIEEFKEDFGFEPDTLPDYLALMGDSSDNIPGVAGIGKKTASQLVQKFKTIEEIYEQLDNVEKKSVRTKLENNWENAKLSKELAIIRRDAPIDFSMEKVEISEPDTMRLVNIFQEHGFRRFLSNIIDKKKDKNASYVLVNTTEELNKLASELRMQERISIDTETTSENPHEAELAGISFSWKENEAFYVPVKAPEGVDILDKSEVLGALREVLESPDILKTGHNIKYDIIVLSYEGVEVRGVDFDTMIGAYLLNPTGRGYSLDNLSLEFLGRKNIPIEELIGKGRNQTTIDKIDIERVSEYACEDADVTLRLRVALEPRLVKMELDKLLGEVEAPLIPVLVEMEKNGVTVDTDFLAKFSTELDEKINEIKSKIFDLSESEFNLDSPKQLSELLFGRLGLPSKKKTSTGMPSTSHEVLEELAAEHKIPALIVEYRSLAKLKNTYVDALPRMVSKKTGRIHTSFNQTATATGRLSSSEPNLQNIPIREEMGRRIRRAFVPRDSSRKILTADYSQIELRLLAHYSKDIKLVAAFENDEDIHASVAAEVFGTDIKQVTSKQRSVAKTVNFATIYGQGPLNLSRQLRMPFNEAKSFIESYHAKYPGLREFMDSAVGDAQRNGYVTTIFNRRRYIPGIDSSSSQVQSQARRFAMNTILQGSAADMIKMAMIRIHSRLKDKEMDALMLLQIHDELVFDVESGSSERLAELVMKEMIGAIPLSVPIKVNMGTGSNWLEAK